MECIIQKRTLKGSPTSHSKSNISIRLNFSVQRKPKCRRTVLNQTINGKLKLTFQWKFEQRSLKNIEH